MVADRETTEIYKGEIVTKKLLSGAEKACSAVSTTFGPYGRNVAITKIFNPPHVTKDGVTVAQSLNLKDPIENVSADLIIQAAAKTAEVAGDGTTSTTILTNALIKNCFEYLKTRSSSTMQLKRDLEELSIEAVKIVEGMSTPTTIDNIMDVALVACNGDYEIAKLVTDAFLTIGEHGIVSVFESRSYKTTLDATDGIKLQASHISPILTKENKVTHNECSIITTDLDIKGQEDAFTLIKLCEDTKLPLLVICNDIDESALQIIAYNKENRSIPIEVIRAPFIADARREAIKDLSIATGATYIAKNEGWRIIDIVQGNLGSSDAVEITLKETNILGRKGDSKAINKRIEFYNAKIDEDIEGLTNNYKKRLAMLSAGAAVLYIGGNNSVEVIEKKDRVDDTVKAVRSAMEQGFVEGGAIAYAIIAKKLINISTTKAANDILAKSLKIIIKNLLANGDIKFTEENLKSHHNNVTKNKIIDPTLVVVSTIKNAIGAANMIFTTDCVIVKEKI